MTSPFAQFVAPTGAVDPTMVIYTDPATGQVWTVPEGHRIWTEIYEPWLAAGNTPLPPA